MVFWRMKDEILQVKGLVASGQLEQLMVGQQETVP